jgi:hypothetical protein
MDKNNLTTYTRYKHILKIISGDEQAEKMIDELIEKCINYITIVCQNELSLVIKADKLDGKDYQEFVMKLDRTRTSAHNSLISCLHSFNRYIIKKFDKKVPVGGIYSYDPLTIACIAKIRTVKSLLLGQCIGKTRTPYR